MTNKEAIERIKDFGLYHAIGDLPHSAKTVEAFDMAISALEAQYVPDTNVGDMVYRQAAIDAMCELMHHWFGGDPKDEIREIKRELEKLPSAQPNIKQAAKLLLDFIESCPGGDSYLITPDGEALRTDWGYATDGIQLIYDWAERRNDG